MKINKMIIISCVLILFLAISGVSASQNTTQDDNIETTSEVEETTLGGGEFR